MNEYDDVVVLVFDPVCTGSYNVSEEHTVSILSAEEQHHLHRRENLKSHMNECDSLMHTYRHL
jgi:hypothetical protein